MYLLLWPRPAGTLPSRDWTRYAWAAALAVSAILSIRSTLHRELAVRQEYAYRLPLQAEGFLNAHAQPAGAGVRYSAFAVSGYHLITENKDGISSDPSAASPEDDLSFTSDTETVALNTYGSSGRSVRVRALSTCGSPHMLFIADARDPMLSRNGEDLAFIRDDHGQGRLVAKTALCDRHAERIRTKPRNLECL